MRPLGVGVATLRQAYLLIGSIDRVDLEEPEVGDQGLGTYHLAVEPRTGVPEVMVVGNYPRLAIEGDPYYSLLLGLKGADDGVLTGQPDEVGGIAEGSIVDHVRVGSICTDCPQPRPAPIGVPVVE